MCNLNTATLDEIANLPGISPKLACEAKLWAPHASSWSELESYLEGGHDAVRAFMAVGAVIGSRAGSRRPGCACDNTSEG
jgi:hypothetical protein